MKKLTPGRYRVPHFVQSKKIILRKIPLKNVRLNVELVYKKYMNFCYRTHFVRVGGHRSLKKNKF